MQKIVIRNGCVHNSKKCGWFGSRISAIKFDYSQYMVEFATRSIPMKFDYQILEV